MTGPNFKNEANSDPSGSGLTSAGRHGGSNPDGSGLTGAGGNQPAPEGAAGLAPSSTPSFTSGAAHGGESGRDAQTGEDKYSLDDPEGSGLTSAGSHGGTAPGGSGLTGALRKEANDAAEAGRDARTGAPKTGG